MTTDTPHIDAMTMQLARFEVPETHHARSYCRAPQSDRIKELEYALIAAKESEAVWKTERDKMDQRRMEAEAEVERLKELLNRAINEIEKTPFNTPKLTAFTAHRLADRYREEMTNDSKNTPNTQEHDK